MLTPADPQDVLGKCHNLTDLNFERNGTHFTCFTGTKVQILTQKLEAALTFLPSQIGALTACTEFTCFTGTKVQILTQKLEAALTFLPSQIGALTALKRLNVDGNNLIQVCSIKALLRLY
jgi:hypothetical protein